MVGLYGHGYTEGGLSLLPLRMTSHPYTSDPPISVQSWGDVSELSTKVMLLLGDAPEHLEFFKDALVNYLFKVEVQDTHRLVLVDDYELVDDPSAVRVYMFRQREGDVLPFSLVVVEVPPLGVVGSAQGDVRVLHAVERFLVHHFGTSRVDGITLVAPPSDEPLHALRNTYHLLTLCFEDVASLTQVVATDSGSHTTLLAALKEYNLRYRSAFIFDSDKAAGDISPEEYFFRQIFRHFDFHGVDDFFEEMQDIEPQRMALTDKLQGGGLDVGDLARMRVVQQYTEVVGVTHRTLSLRQLLLQVKHRDETSRTQHLVLGEPNNKASRVLVLMGDKGAGKTTLLTAVVNHLLGVKHQDRFRFLVDGDPLNRLEKAHRLEKTKFTTAYTFTAMPQPYDKYNLTVIDTPGLRGPEEPSHNKQVAARVAALREVCGIKLHVLSLVAVADTDSLQDTYRAVYKNITTLLAKEGVEKLLLLATKSDAKRAAVNGELRRLGLPFTKTLRFSSHSVLADPQDRDEDDATHEVLTKLYWKMEEHSIQRLLAELFT